ncbi:MFS transporter [Paenibacillus periandrae]|uniref:MFS transporter n=1 Tax=Paenibacillus periandrae TaxID=1761741 RepID=UPI001F093532|nr:MFS transporter [Paenibacillus periandrae]
MWKTLKDMFDLSPGVRRFIATEASLGIGIGMFQLVLNLHLLDVKLNEEQIGELTSVGALFMGLISVPSGLLAGRISRKNALVIGLFLHASGYVGFGFGSTLPVFYASQLLMTLGITLLTTSEIQLLYHYSRSQKEEIRAFSLLFAIFTLFVGIGTLLGGYLPIWLGGHTSIYQGTIFAASVMLFAGCISRAMLLPKEPKSEPTAPAVSAARANSRTGAWKPSRMVWILGIFMLLNGLAFGFLAPYLNVIVKFRLGWADTSVSLLLTAAGVFTFIGSMLMPVLLERFSAKKAYFYVYAANFAFTALLVAAFPSFLFGALLLLRGGAFTLLTNMTVSQAMSCISEKERNLFAGMRTVFGSAGSAVSSYATGFILAGKNYSLPFLLTTVAIAAGFVYFLIWVRPLFQAKLEESG